MAQDAVLPVGVKAIWDLDKAHREKTETRERVCLNGLWRWQPATEETPPTGGWGFFKVPGSWPGMTDYMQKDFQTVYPNTAWKDARLRDVTAAWYQRQIEIPAGWAGRRIELRAEVLNSFATVFVDGKAAGEMRFPLGVCDLTAVCPPGKHLLSLRVDALPLKAVMLSYADTNRAKEVKGEVRRRGLCGDVWLVAAPDGPRVADVRLDTSVRRGEIGLNVALDGLEENAKYILRAEIADGDRVVRRFASAPFGASELENGGFKFLEKWKADKLWDLHTPQNQYQLSLSLCDAAGKTLDAVLPVRFGFREFWIEGRDFFLNGTRIFLSAVPLDNAEIGVATATYEAAKESLLRLKSFGINFVYTHNYGCEPGAHLSFEEILRAADDVGMLVSFSQPHFSAYDWNAADSDASNGYARHAEFYVRVAQNHPSVVCYSMSHNATGYNEDMNPDWMDGKHEPRDNWSRNNRRQAARAEALVRKLDPSRIVYHHASGDFGPLHNSNFYVNFVPIQEMDDWFEHWAAEGVKPMFTCEYGVPFPWDWTMYRGWFRGKRDFGSAAVGWEYCSAEWNAQFLGDRAFQLGDPEKANLRFEARQFREGKLFHRWDYPFPPGSPMLDDQLIVSAMYLTDNWRAFRTWGLSANSPWDFAPYWKRRDGVDRSRIELNTDWENLQRPGFSPDYIEQRYETMNLAYERADWVPSPAAEVLLRNNQPLLAYIAGKPERFTSKDHNFLAGEIVEKQLIILNNSRETVSGEWSAFFSSRCFAAGQKFRIPTGEQQRFRLSVPLASHLAPGTYELAVEVRFRTGQTQTDAFSIHILPSPPAVKSPAKTALFDPKGETATLLKSLGVAARTVDANADLSAFDTLIVGKAALTPVAPAPDIAPVREGLKVIIFEQTSEVLEKRFGFRVAEYGLRNVFPRVPDHPLLEGLDIEKLRNWRGEATILPPRLSYQTHDRRFNGAPTVKWCGLDVTRVWRCGNRGNVASVLLEKPARGDFLPVLDGGYSLQYSPLMEYREGRGVVLFCQMDVTGRSESDPAAERLARNILRYVADWKPAPRRFALYAGKEEGKAFLARMGIAAVDYDGGKISEDQVLIVTGGARQKLPAHLEGARVLAVALDADDAEALKATVKRSEHIGAFFEPQNANSPFAGIGPADVQNRAADNLPLVTSAETILGGGVLAQNGNVVFCQLAPWRFDYSKQYNLKRSFRRSSFLLARLLANHGIASPTPVLERFRAPVAGSEQRWLDGLYLDTPEEMDDPYRFFRW